MKRVTIFLSIILITFLVLSTTQMAFSQTAKTIQREIQTIQNEIGKLKAEYQKTKEELKRAKAKRLKGLFWGGAKRREAKRFLKETGEKEASLKRQLLAKESELQNKRQQLKALKAKPEKPFTKEEPEEEKIAKEAAAPTPRPTVTEQPRPEEDIRVTIERERILQVQKTQEINKVQNSLSAIEQINAQKGQQNIEEINKINRMQKLLNDIRKINQRVR